jgi:hypothetical protein
MLDDLSVSTVLKGAAAGAAATWTMNQVTTWMYAHESDAAREREDRARGGQTAYVSAASRLAGAAGLKLEEAQRARAGTAMHWATGVTAGMAYAIARQRWPAVSRANGLPFGIGFFLLIDEAMNTAFGFTPPPRAFPWQAHARGAAGHVVFGLVTHTALAALDRLIPRRRRFEALLSAN